jgi:hypothetical protein
MNRAKYKTRCFRVLRINQPERSPKKTSSPHRLCTLSSSHNGPCPMTSSVIWQAILHYMPRNMTNYMTKGRVLTIRVLPSRPKWTRWSTLKQWCLFRVLRTYMGIKCLSPGMGLYSYDVGYTFEGFKPKTSILLVRCSLSDLRTQKKISA